MGWLNIGSLVLGMVAWILPLLNLSREQENTKRWTTYSFLSFICCSTAILFQLMVQKFLIEIEDFSALMDITSSVVLASSVLLIVTILLNVLAWVKYTKTI
ncbi:hypothetical protein ACFOST_13900 [Cytobacillus kochii]|uniref:hypothetical protein n=1 Tax=Cytobacillus kochii TaxID=859143 RepID=UPI0027807AC7|nr:hypothetical protein [Cytobacillus kochii]MDQ0185772.1 cytochrome c oxidase subunit 4 [Cytobacillus kochii]